MTAISPTRVSLYDFLIEDTAPIDPILADSGHISLLQASILRRHGIQAIVSALLTYEQRHGANSVFKKLFNRTAIKELRQYNAFNFVTMERALQYDTTAKVIFKDDKTFDLVCGILADSAQTTKYKTHTVLSALSLIALRELAILADFSQLDDEDLSKWFGYQNQFMRLDREQYLSDDIQTHRDGGVTTVTLHIPEPLSTTEETQSADNTDLIPTILIMDNYDMGWHKVTGYNAPDEPKLDVDASQSDAVPNYAKAIGLMSNGNDSKIGTSDNLATTQNNSNSIGVFSHLPNIKLPNSRWLLQLGKVSDIYLSRNRLKIAPEPESPPPRPLINFGIPPEPEASESTTDDTPFTYDSAEPLWKNKTIYLILGVIGILSVLSVLKFQYKALPSGRPSTVISASSTKTQQPAYDIAVMRINDEDTTENEVQEDLVVEPSVSDEETLEDDLLTTDEAVSDDDLIAKRDDGDNETDTSDDISIDDTLTIETTSNIKPLTESNSVDTNTTRNLTPVETPADTSLSAISNNSAASSTSSTSNDLSTSNNNEDSSSNELATTQPQENTITPSTEKTGTTPSTDSNNETIRKNQEVTGTDDAKEQTAEVEENTSVDSSADEPNSSTTEETNIDDDIDIADNDAETTSETENDSTTVGEGSDLPSINDIENQDSDTTEAETE